MWKLYEEARLRGLSLARQLDPETVARFRTMVQHLLEEGVSCDEAWTALKALIEPDIRNHDLVVLAD